MELFEKDRQGAVLRIERSSIHDGDGFRTVVFLKGCPLCCQWCSTPESQSFAIERTAENEYGRLMSVEEVMCEVRKDSAFFFHSGGGMTLSGGELLSQPEFSLSLLKASRLECISTAIETSFLAPWQQIATLLPYVCTAFVDLKLFDKAQHKNYCGVDNELILQNLLATNEAAGAFRLIVRIPIIPGINNSPEELHKMGTFCAKLCRLEAVHLLPYHRLGTETYKKLGRDYLLGEIVSPTQEQMETCREILREHSLLVC